MYLIIDILQLFNSFHDPEYVEATCRLQNENLGLGYIDLYLMHTPVGHVYKGFDEPMIPFAQNPKIDFSDTDYVDTYKAMEKCVKLGLTRSIGVSNFNSEQISRVLKVAEIKPVTNQVECSPNLNQKKLTAFCKSHGMVLTAYSPLGKPHMYAVDKNLPKPAFQDPRVQVIGDKYGKTPGQIVLRYLVSLTLHIVKAPPCYQKLNFLGGNWHLAHSKISDQRENYPEHRYFRFQTHRRRT